jgi:excisionase family DNA binding protein
MADILKLEQKWLSREEAAEYVRIAVRTFDKLVDEKTMPAPYKISDRRVVWDKMEIDEKVKNCQANAANTWENVG